MIGADGESVFRKEGGDFLGSFLASDVDDGRSIDSGEFFQEQVFPLSSRARGDPEIEIRTMEAELHVICSGDAKRLPNIPCHLGRGGGR